MRKSRFVAGFCVIALLLVSGEPALAASASDDLPFPAGTVQATVTFSHPDKNGGKSETFDVRMAVGYYSQEQKRDQADIAATKWGGWGAEMEPLRDFYDSDEELRAAAANLGIELQFADLDASPRLKCAGSSFYLSLGKRLGIPELIWDSNAFGRALRLFGEPADPVAPRDIVMFSNDDRSAEHFALVADSWSEIDPSGTLLPVRQGVTVWSKNQYENFWVAEYGYPLKDHLYDNSDDPMVAGFLGTGVASKTFRVQSYRLPSDLKVDWRYWTPETSRFPGWWIANGDPKHLFLIGPSSEFITQPADVNRHPLLITDLKHSEQITAAYSAGDTIFATEWPRYRSRFLTLMEQHMGAVDFQRYAANTKFLATRGRLDAAGTKLTLGTPTAIPTQTGSPRELVLEAADLFYHLKSVEVSRWTPDAPQWSTPEPRQTGRGEEPFGWDQELAGGRVHSELNSEVAYCFPQSFPAESSLRSDGRWEITGRPNLSLEVRDSEFKRELQRDFRKKMGGATIRAQLDVISDQALGAALYPDVADMPRVGVPELNEGVTQLHGPVLAQEVDAPAQVVAQADLLTKRPELTIVTSADFAAASQGALRFTAVYELRGAVPGTQQFQSCLP